MWPAHNAAPHEFRHPRVERRFWAAFVHRVDGVIHLGEAGRRMVVDRFPELASRPSTVVVPGHFQGS